MSPGTLQRSMLVSVAVQTHPWRSELAAGLLARLVEQGAWAELAVDPEPNEIRSPWRTYRHALETTPAGCTHRLIVQDDTLPCPAFVGAARLALSHRPDRLVSFYVGGEPSECANAVFQASARGDAWARLSTTRWVPCIALAWPVTLIRPVLDWIDARNYPPSFRGDDEIVGRACTALGMPVLATVPCLVQHPDDVVSLIGLRAWNGRDPGRVACCFIQDDCDPLLIDWSRGPS